MKLRKCRCRLQYLHSVNRSIEKELNNARKQKDRILRYMASGKSGEIIVYGGFKGSGYQRGMGFAVMREVIQEKSV